MRPIRASRRGNRAPSQRHRRTTRRALAAVRRTRPPRRRAPMRPLPRTGPASSPSELVTQSISKGRPRLPCILTRLSSASPLLELLRPRRPHGIGVVNGRLVKAGKELRSNRGARASGQRERLAENRLGVDRHPTCVTVTTDRPPASARPLLPVQPPHQRSRTGESRPRETAFCGPRVGNEPEPAIAGATDALVLIQVLKFLLRQSTGWTAWTDWPTEPHVSALHATRWMRGCALNPQVLGSSPRGRTSRHRWSAA